MSVTRKPFTVSLNAGEKRAIYIAAKLSDKYPAPFCREVALENAKRIIADHEKNNASRDKKDALEKATKEYEEQNPSA